MGRFLVDDGRVVCANRGAFGWSLVLGSPSDLWTQNNGKSGLTDEQAKAAIKAYPSAVEVASWDAVREACSARSRQEASYAATAAAHGFSD